jgi:hypothetical protein
LVVERQVDLEGERREVRSGRSEEAAKRGEAEAFEITQAVLERLAGGKGAGGGRKGVDLAAEAGVPGFGGSVGGEGAVPAGSCPVPLRPFGLSFRTPLRLSFPTPFGLSLSKPSTSLQLSIRKRAVALRSTASRQAQGERSGWSGRRGGGDRQRSDGARA